MPLTVDLLQGNVCLRFMASCRSKKVDHTFLDGIISTKSDVGVLELFDQPTVISALTQTPIAIGNHVWDDEYNNFVEKKVLERLVSHEAWLQGDLSYNQFHCQQRSQQPIYLFLHPPPPNPNQCWGETSSLHFWSFHEDGQKPLPPEICNDLGLPTTLEYKDWGYESMSWSTKLYKQLDEYQRLRGFDPTTTNFARHLGYARNIFNPVHDTDRFHDDYKDQHIECPRSPDLDYGCSNGDNGVIYPAIQKKHNVEKCSHTLSNPVVIPTPTHIIANGRTNAEEGRMDCCYYMDQNCQSTNDDIFDVHTMAEPRLQHIPLDLRRYASNYSPAHTGYPTTTSSLPNCTASAHPYKSHWNSILPSFPEVLPTTNESFSVFDGIMNAASTTGQTHSTAGRSLEILQHTILPVPSHGATSSWPHRNPYAGGAVNDGFSHSTSTPTSSLSFPSDIYTVGHSIPIPGERNFQTVGSPGTSRFERRVEHDHRTSPITSSGAFPMSPYTPAAGYPSNPLPMGGLPDILQTAGHDYRSIPFDAANGFYDGAPMFHNHNTDHRTDTGVPDTARGFDAPSQGELDELCIRFERLAIV
ncbi:hypothetical protein PQX77_016962 [Marasmius sp. AFHP31]|nr:hypothetical protein PQX77_016962 [Marasmius sp. AFHP31]